VNTTLDLDATDRAQRTTAQVDPDDAASAVRRLLEALGQDVADEHLRETPRRVAAAYAELLTPRPFNVTTFPNDEGYDELVLARGIRFHTLWQHHLLPITGFADVGYLPGERIVGLSKLARVVVRAEHLCMSLRGVQAEGVTTVTSSLHGLLREDPPSRAEFLSLTGGREHN
jgi:GTP cyclohydrolase IA